MAGASSSGILLGISAFLLGAAGVVAALRRRRGRARYAETYAATGGTASTAVSVGCGAVLMLGGLVLIVLTLVFRH